MLARFGLSSMRAMPSVSGAAQKGIARGRALSSLPVRQRGFLAPMSRSFPLTGASRPWMALSLAPYSSAAPQGCEGVQKVFTNSCKKTSKLAPKVEKGPLTLSDKAVKKIQEVVIAKGKDPAQYGLRIQVVQRGCSGNSYDLSLGDIESAKANKDLVYQQEGAIVILEQKSLFYLIGMSLDHKDSDFTSGFELDNPNVAKACGCGSSFKAKKKMVLKP